MNNLALVENPPLAPLDDIEAQRLRLFVQNNLTSDLVLQVLEECLIEENATYNPIDFAEALKQLQQKDSGRYHMLKALMEGYATKEGMVMVDPKLVTASFKQRLKELELLKAMSPFRRFWYRLGLAIKVLVGETTKTQALQEAIQVTGEVQVAKEELAVIELKKSQASRDADAILTNASSSSRGIIEEANRRATETTETIYRQAREEVSKERVGAVELLENLYKQIQKSRKELDQLANAKLQGGFGMKNPYKTGAGAISFISDGVDFSTSSSASLSASPSMSPSASLSQSASPSASHWEDDK